MMQYMCKYSPIELIKAFGTEVVMPNGEAEDLNWADSLIHGNVCAHARQVLGEARHQKAVLLTNCCDSIRRVADTLALETAVEAAPAADGHKRTALKASPRVHMLDLPHNDNACAIRLFAGTLKRFRDNYAGETGLAFDRETFLREWKNSAEVWRIKRGGMAGAPYVAVMGARASEELLIAIHKKMLPLGVEDLTCLGCRSIGEPPSDAGSLTEDELFEAYAGALLRQIPCMRMTAVAGRRELTEDPGLKGIVYNTIRFCDYYDFEYASLRSRTDVPILKIESDYTSQTRGQLMTRLEAFAEQFAGIRSSLGSRDKTASKEAGTAGMTNDRKEGEGLKPLYVGIDSGSTTTNAVAINENGEMEAWCVLRTGAKASQAAEAALDDLAAQTGRDKETFTRVCATGYGRMGIAAADFTRTEITCHARGAHILDPKARCVIDIGGQDSKVICLDKEGQVTGFVMNDKCAAGTGRFLEMMARTLELELGDMDKLGLEWKKDLTISSTCTVFAESEVISLIAEDRETSDIIHGLNKAVAQRTYGLVQRVRGTGPFMMTGGVARNPGLVKEIEAKIGESLSISDHPDLAGALGAAHFARDGESM